MTVKHIRTTVKELAIEPVECGACGVCPCCNRSFTNVRRHMTSQHPDYTIPEPADG